MQLRLELKDFTCKFSYGHYLSQRQSLCCCLSFSIRHDAPFFVEAKYFPSDILSPAPRNRREGWRTLLCQYNHLFIRFWPYHRTLQRCISAKRLSVVREKEEYINPTGRAWCIQTLGKHSLYLLTCFLRSSLICCCSEIFSFKEDLLCKLPQILTQLHTRRHADMTHVHTQWFWQNASTLYNFSTCQWVSAYQSESKM